MDPVQSSPAPITVNPQPSDVTGELAHVNEEMYKKNLELAEKNKTLSLLRKIDEIVLSSVTDVQQIAQQVANAITADLELPAVVILLLDKEKDGLIRLAVSQTKDIIDAEVAVNQTFVGIKTPLAETENFVVKAVRERSKQVTKNLYDVLRPTISQEEAAKVQAMVGVKSSIVYPLIIRSEPIGAMIVSIGEDEATLSDYKRDLIARLSGVIGIAMDNALLYQKIQDANERLKELDKLKDEFVSLASHELRTPMTAIKSYLWMILEDKQTAFPEKHKTYLSRAYESTDRLIKLVNDMLNVSRIESGRMSINALPTDIVQLAKDAVSEILPAAQKQGIFLMVALPQTPPPLVSADQGRIKEVLINLVGNAIKFTPPNGRITISFSQENTMVVTHVSDTGAGIRKDDLQRLFQKFSVVGTDNSKKLNAQGTGLGLYISKSIIELHHGKISVFSEGEGKGTTFSFSLPFAPNR